MDAKSPRWAALVAGLYIMMVGTVSMRCRCDAATTSWRVSNTCGPVLVSRAQTAGTAYAFGVYSPQLKADLHFTQNEIQTVATLGNFGSPILAGIAFDRYGPMAAGGVGIVSMVRRVEC
jgi:hypothetical protein